MPQRIALRQKIMMGSQPITQPTPLRPPMSGWNTRDDLDGMDPTDAVTMDNFYADANGLNCRKGSLPWSTGGAAAIATLAEYYTGATRKLIACGGGHIYDASVQNATMTSLASGFASDLWSTANFSGRLFLANGTDPVQSINGSTVAAAGFTGPATNPIGVYTFKGRLYFWLANSPVFWYAPLGNITGALSSFDLSTIAQFGGNILTLCNFSHDGGDGITNQFCIVLTTGEILLYLGSDPSLSTNWTLTAKYKLGAPIGPRSVAAYGGDVYLSTYDDHVALQEQLTALKVGQTPPRSKITGAVRDAMVSNPTSPYYQALYYGKGRRVVFNIPNTDGTFDQHIYNTSNQAWQRFKGLNGLCWSEFNTNLYFGTTNGQVWQADTGYTDNGATIVCLAQQAWNPIQIATQKRLAGVRPVVQNATGQGYTFKVGFDYQAFAIAILPQTLISYPLWDISPWDTTYWASEISVNSLLVHAAAGTGTVLGLMMLVSAVSPFTWMRTDLITETSKQI